MFSVSNWQNGYQIKLSEPGTGRRGKTFFAVDLEQVHIALDHYHVKKHDKTFCPLCINMNKKR